MANLAREANGAVVPLERKPKTYRQPAVSRVAEGILAAMEAKELRPGDRLPPERELMLRFRVSRPVVREAIAGLVTRGFIVTRPGHRPLVQQQSYDQIFSTLGSVVSRIISTEEGIHSLFSLRVLIEAALVRHAASAARERDIEDLKQAVAANFRAIGDFERFYATDVALHALFYRIPGNPLLPAIQNAYVEWLSGPWAKMPRNVEINRMNYVAHDAIVSAIVRRDADEAERMLRSHLTTAWQFVRAALSSAPSSSA
jgi:DNA-binding FadR family transcriptional regulator